MPTLARSPSAVKSSHGKSVIKTFDYCDENGALLFQVVRQEPGRDGQKKSFYQRQPDGKGGWTNNLKGVQLVPYRLPEILKQDQNRIIFIVEGEKCVDALWAIDASATTNPQGAGKWKDEHSEHLRGRHAVILPDNDDPGRKHAQAMAKSLGGIAASVRILELPGLPPKGDVVDWLAAGGDKEQLMKLALAAMKEQGAKENESDAEDDEEDNKESNGRKKSVAEQLVKMALDAGVQLLHTPDETAYAVVPEDGHKMTLRLRNSSFASWLRCRYYRLSDGRTPGAQAAADAVSTLEGIAQHDRPEETVHLRVAEKDGKLYIDLCDRLWRAVEVDSSGWRIVQNPPVRFRRSRGMLPLPEPKRGGSLDRLKPFLNVASDDDWRLAVACLLAYYRPRGPYPLMVLNGQQGSAKSTTARIIRGLIDPNTAPIRCEPKEPRDLAIAANGSWVLVYDNLSSIPAWLSDALCRLSTGGGFSTRQLYTDDEEAIFDAQRPVILTSIEDVTSRGDLLERALIWSLPPIPESRRVTEEQLKADFDQQAPTILGAVLTALSGTMRELPKVKLPALPRMADFAVWATACERSLGWKAGAFLAAYDKNRIDANNISLDSSPIYDPLLQMLENCSKWSGTATELLEQLQTRVSEQTTRSKDWPKKGCFLSGKLKRLAPNLALVGIVVELRRDRKGSVITIKRDTLRETASPASPASPAQENKAFRCDADNSVERHQSSEQRHGDAGDAARDAGDAAGDAGVTLPASQKRHENKPRDAGDAGDAVSRTSSAGYLAQGLTPDDAQTPFDE